MAKIDKARFWTGVLYPENMREDWKEVIGDTLQYPYAYCQHSQDKDSKSEHRKDHVHLIVAFPNTTTYKHALNVMDLLSAEGKKAINKCEAVVGIRNVYDYLIHDTEDCRKKGKGAVCSFRAYYGQQLRYWCIRAVGYCREERDVLGDGRSHQRAWLHQLHGLL